jgi:uncharacterized protein YkwD
MKNYLIKITIGGCFLLINLTGCAKNNSISIIEPSFTPTESVAQVSSIPTLETSIYNQINQYRQTLNLAPIELNSFLSEQARQYSDRVAKGEISFENSNFDSQFEVIQEKIPFQRVKVNLAYNQGYPDPATATVNNWLESSTHRQNMEGDFNLMGIGVAKNQENQYYFTHILLKEIPPISPQTLKNLEQEVFLQVNQYRQSRGLSPLRLDERISQQARLHSEAMASGSASFSHDGFEGRVEIISNSINYRGAAENLAYNQGHADPVKVAVQGWIDSPGHHKNMIGDFNLTGIGVSRNAKGEYYMNQLFILTP